MSKHSKKYREFAAKMPQTAVKISEAVELLKSYPSKADSSFELHINLGVDPRNSEQLVRGTIQLPHGTGKKVKIMAVVSEGLQDAAKQAGASIVGGEELIAKLKSTGKVEADVVVASPDMMKNLAPVAKLLGTKGLMPSPKTETVTPDPAQTISNLLSGKVSFRMDESANLHQAVGKTSFESSNIEENINTFLTEIKKIKPSGVKGAYIKSVTLSTTHSPGIKLEV